MSIKNMQNVRVGELHCTGEIILNWKIKFDNYLGIKLDWASNSTVKIDPNLGIFQLSLAIKDCFVENLARFIAKEQSRKSNYYLKIDFIRQTLNIGADQIYKAIIPWYLQEGHVVQEIGIESYSLISMEGDMQYLYPNL
jgi:hypothetical protein